MSEKKKKDNEISFEDSLKKLEEIVEELEKGELSLDEALKLYEEGMEFSDKCMARLNESKQKVEKLTREENNKYKTEPFSLQNKDEDVNFWYGIKILHGRKENNIGWLFEKRAAYW